MRTLTHLPLSILFITISTVCNAQFAGIVGTVGTTAMYKDSSAFVNWATQCTVKRGLQNIANTAGGYATTGADSNAIGKAGTNGIVSLGDRGEALLRFQYPITNAEGYDFAVFENAFTDKFLELAVVEVSSDGVNFVRFPATSNTPTSAQIGAFDTLGDATLLNNLAGKYRGQYGTPFDLQELQGNVLLDINHITHVKIIDIIGSINPVYATYDSNNNPINDPYPTAFASSGFDLDAVGVINQSTVGINELKNTSAIHIYPNPSTNRIHVDGAHLPIKELVLLTLNGNELLRTTSANMDINTINQGIYLLKITSADGNYTIRKVVKN